VKIDVGDFNINVLDNT